MNKWIPALLMLAFSALCSGCIFGKKTHSAKPQAKVDTTAVAAPKKDTVKSVAVTVDTAHRTTAVATLDTTKKVPVMPDSATIAAYKIKNQLKIVGDTLLHKPFSYTTFDGRAKMHYEGNGASQDFTANFRIKKDSVIWVSVSALGGMVAVARAYITPDSIKLVDYLHKEVILMPISDANKLLPAPVDFSILQNLFTGQPLVSNGTVDSVADSSVAWVVALSRSYYLQQLSFAKADSTLQQQQMTVSTANPPKVAVQQTDYVHDDSRAFSRSRVVHIDNKGISYELDMDFINQSFNKVLEFPFSYSKNYAVNPRK